MKENQRRWIVVFTCKNVTSCGDHSSGICFLPWSSLTRDIVVNAASVPVIVEPQDIIWTDGGEYVVLSYLHGA